MLQELGILMGGQQYKKLSERKYEVIMKKYDLKKMEIEILYFISHCGENDTAKDIANVQYISKAHISNSIEELTNKKYLTVIEDRNDRRYNHLSLTELAKQIIGEIEVARRELMDIIFQNVTLEEREMIFKVSKKIVDNISEELKKSH